MWPAAKPLFDHLAALGDAIALREGSRSLSYAQLLAEIEVRSQHLQQLSARRIALALDNGIDWVLWDLATLQAGLVCVPVPGFFSTNQQVHVLDSASIDCLIGPENTLYSALGFSASAAGVLQRPRAVVSELPVGTCKITYTSGTTGQPKGVCLDVATQLAVAHSLVQASASCQVERHLCVLPLATLLENIAGIYAPLLAGAQIELMPMAQVGLLGASQFDLPRFLTALGQAQPNSLILLPQLLLALVSAAERGLPVPDSLRFIAVGGGRVSSQLLQRADALGLPIFEGYGLSECASVVCLNTPEQRRIGTVGQPLPRLQVRLGADQEVQVKGPRLLVYLGEPVTDEEWLGTGDLGHFEGPFLVLHGRKKHQFITAFGRNVNPEWVEAELVQQLPIAQAWLHGEALPGNVAVLVPRFETTSDSQLAEAVAAANQSLPDYARVHHWLRRNALFSHYQSAIEQLMADQTCYGDA